MKKIIEALNNVDPNNVGEANRFLSGLHSDIVFFNEDKALLNNIAAIIDKYLSINSKGAYQDWAERRFFNSLSHLRALCKK